MAEAEAALIVTRALVYAAGLFLWGTTAYLAAFVGEPLRGAIAGRLAGITRLSALLLWLMLLASLPLRASLLAEGGEAALSLPLLSALLWETAIGFAWQVQMLAATLLAAGALMRPRRPALIAPLAALFLITLPLGGHAAMLGLTLTGLAHRANDALHLLSAGAWAGALLPVLLILPRLREGESRPAAQAALLNFSTMGHIAVALVLITGLINAWLILGAGSGNGMGAEAGPDGLMKLVAGLWTSPYGRLLALKATLVALMVTLALVNRYALVPRLAASPPAGRALMLGTLAEIGLSALVLALVAAFGTMDPS
ncbi:hypothetical protein BJF92_20975 [Rhizobium rhizosphaerae]|uniref:Copper resistance protein D domain-containing protein n=1 Tax=Xaviernesmea rhizosphaerae TaxID=1672749 RepID=A0A1Q9ANL7_9HYPH|nr:hypothetical protein BJF92_20975 [Xaviernesmea rhizosphaerae]